VGTHVERARPDGAEREPFDLLVLRQVLTDAVDLGAGTDLHIPDCQSADLVRSREVPIQQHRRHSEHIGDIVEPITGIVGREQRGDIHIQAKQVANGIAVLAPIEAPYDRTTWIRLRGSRPIERRFQPVGQALASRGVRPGGSGRRHHARL
jgi:hypothetical protein